MKDLWRKTWALFRQNPRVIAPAVLAGWLALGMERLNRMAAHALFTWFATEHSVLGGDYLTRDLARAQRRALNAGVPLGLAHGFLAIGVFVFAMFLTARRVRIVSEGVLPAWTQSLRFSKPQWKSILLLSLAVMGIMAAFGLLEVAFTSWFFFRSNGRVMGLLAGLLMTTCISWLLAPWAVNLLRKPEPGAAMNARMPARIFAIAAFAAQRLLAEIESRAEAGIVIEQHWEVTAFALFNTTVTSIPMGLLFVALAMLAADAEGAGQQNSEHPADSPSFAEDASTGA